jgi:hypothetical protein
MSAIGRLRPARVSCWMPAFEWEADIRPAARRVSSCPPTRRGGFEDQGESKGVQRRGTWAMPPIGTAGPPAPARAIRAPALGICGRGPATGRCEALLLHGD